MSYRKEREQFIDRMSREGLPYTATLALLRCATTIQRCAELACSSEEADRDRIPCPADTFDLRARPRKPSGPCLCDGQNGAHVSIPRITLTDYRTEQRARAAVPEGWMVVTEGDPRGYTLRVIPPSYAERNAGRDRFNVDAIGVPSGDTRLRF
jgi:hypothetical protein